MGWRPTANKYREGKVKRALKRELKVLDIAGLEPVFIVPPKKKAPPGAHQHGAHGQGSEFVGFLTAVGPTLPNCGVKIGAFGLEL